MDLRLGSLPYLGYGAQPGTLGLYPDDVPCLLPAANDVVRGGEPEEALAPVDVSINHALNGGTVAEQ